MSYLFWVFNFFVISNDDGRFVSINYNLDVFFNSYVYLAIAVGYFVFGALNKRRITCKTNLNFFLAGSYITLYNIFGYLFGGSIHYFYTSLILLSSYYIGSTHNNKIYKFVKYSLILLLPYTAVALLSGFLGLEFLPVSNNRFLSISEEGIFRLSNPLIFGQRNTAGAAIASLYIVYSSLVYSKFIDFKFYIFIIFIALAASTMSATGILVILVCFFATTRIKVSSAMFGIAVGFFVSIVLGDLTRKLDSFYIKGSLFIEFTGSMDLQTLLIGSIDQSLRPWVESSLLDMVYDLGFILPMLIIFHFLYFFVKNAREFRVCVLYGLFLLLLLFSNSTLQPPIILCLVLSYNIFERSRLIIERKGLA